MDNTNLWSQERRPGILPRTEGTMAKTSENGRNGEDVVDEAKAFVVVRHGDRTWVVDLPVGTPVALGRDPTAAIAIDAIGSFQGRVLWDGQRLTLDADAAATFLNGKRLEGPVDLKPGDELAIGQVQLVVGLATPYTTGTRRALTHHEFRERLYEEMARAARGGRPTALVMVQAKPGEGGRAAASALESFRAGDVVGTYAHDELELLLPDTGRDTAQAVVERIFGQAGVQVTVGLAIAPADGDNPERLMRSARQALQRARKTGRTFASAPPRMPSEAAPTTQDPMSRDLVATIEQIAPTDTPVLLTGELSSGKGAFARLLHQRSRRMEGPFVVVQCASLSNEAALAEALGTSGTPGDETFVAQARGGTLLLDEIGDMTPEVQKRLVEVLDAEGSAVRIVSTTHRVLAGLVERGAFDRALYDRLAGAVLEVPPLRSRPEDIIPLAERFAIEFGAARPVRMSPGALARLRSYPWPGNVLELRNSIERSVRLANGGEILAEHLPSEILPAVSGEGRLREHVDSVERDAIIKALADSNHNQTHAAKRLGISRRALIYKMEKYGLKPPPGTARRGG